MQQEREQFEGQIAALQAENELLTQANQELHMQNQRLQQDNHQLQQDNQELQQQLQVVVPVVPDYLGVRDRILKNWRVAKAPEKKERIMSALDKFIEAVTESTQISTPGQDHDTSR